MKNRRELERELEQLQMIYHVLNEQMITGTIDPIEFHYRLQLNEERQRAIYKVLEEMDIKEQEQLPNTYNIQIKTHKNRLT